MLSFNSTFNWDKAHFGYYQVGDFLTFSKLEAIEVEQRTGQKVEWIFNDTAYSCFDWTEEPSETLEELYMARARQIREQYDYIVLLYSAGSDSQNMLQAFVQAGIPFEEVLCYSNLQASKDKYSYHNAELFISALPTAQRLKDTNPLYKDLIIREVDLSEATADIWNRISPLDYPYVTNGTAGPIHYTKSYLREIVPEYRQLVEKKKFVLVWGAEKPLQIVFDKGHFYHNFIDCLEGHVHPRTQMINRANEHDEFFYLPPESPKIVIKQCHTIVNFLRNLRRPHPYVSADPNKGTRLGSMNIYDPESRSWRLHWLQLDGVNQLIYPWFDPNIWYQSRKPMNSIYSDRDNWFYQHPELSGPFNQFVQGMIDRFGDRWLQSDPLNTNIRFVRKWISKPYLIR